MPGLRSDRKKWIHAFDNVATLFFFVDRGAYDELLWEDSSTNRMEESLTLFRSLCGSRWFKAARIILFLHKVDKLGLKLARQPEDLQKYIPDFDGNPTNLEEVKIHIRDKFLAIASLPKGKFELHFTSMLDRASLVTAAFTSLSRETSS
jgi:hypothetical protein